MNTSQHDDRIFIETRVVTGIVVVVLALAFIALYIYPDFTDVDFAWTIKPDFTALLMGAGYTGGAYYLLRVTFAKQWHRAHLGFIPITLFTIFMAGATVLHLDKFHLNSLQALAWKGIYAVTPFVVPFVWWRNHSTDPGVSKADEYMLAKNTRWALGIFGGLGVLVSLVFFVRPDWMIALAPWKLTELTARVGTGWSALAAMTVLMIGYDGRWSAARLLVEAGMISVGLILLAIPRAVNDLDWANPGAWLLVASLAALLIVFGVTHLRLDAASRSPARTN